MNLLICDTFTPEAIAQLEVHSDIQIKKSEKRQPTSEELKDSHILMIRSRTRVDSQLIAKAPHLKLVVTATAGFDHIDLKACKEKNIKVSCTPLAQSESAAELTILLILGVLRQWPTVTQTMRSHKWKDELPQRGKTLSNLNVGLIGLGRVGSRVAERLKPFGCRLLAHDPYIKKEEFDKLSCERLGLTEVLRQSDVVSLHVPLNEETKGFINKVTLQSLPENSYLINTSRGDVIVEEDLIQALQSGHLAGAGLDVFHREPLSQNSGLRKIPSVLLTPHIGAFTDKAVHKASEMASTRVMEFLRGGPVSDQLI